jgi:S1-C subfamily serine protease
MRLSVAILVYCLTVTPTVLSSATSIYKDCSAPSSSDNICRYDGNGEFAGHYSINSYKNDDEYWAYFFPSKEFAAILHKSDDTQLSIDVSQEGFVGRNMKEGEYYPTQQNYNNTLPEIRQMFLGQPEWRRKRIQSNLKRLELYNSTVDGLWGRNTFNAIIGYNAVFQQSLYLRGRWAADQLLNKISNHSRFDYRNGQLKVSQRANGWQTCGYGQTDNISRCFSEDVCKWATVENPVRSWNMTSSLGKAWVAEAKRRNLSCGVVTESNVCSYKNTSNCTNDSVCRAATFGDPKKWAIASSPWRIEAVKRGLNCGVGEQSNNSNEAYRSCAFSQTDSISRCFANNVCSWATVGKPKRWNVENPTGYLWYTEAIKRGLTCGVEQQIASTPPADTCANDPTKCGAVELCQKAVSLQNGDRVWKKDSYGKQYADAAKSVGLTCNVDSENPDKTYRVANGTGFYVSYNGDVVTNQHVIDGCNEVQIHSNGEMAPASLISQDRVNDLALLRTNHKAESAFKLAAENPYLLQDIIAAGFPFGESVSSTIKVTRGVVSSLSGLGDNSGQIQIDAALQPGNSGGPIIDENGNVVGVAVAKLDLEKSIESFGVVPENVNFGIKLSNLKTFLDDNNVAYSVGNEREIKSSALGKLATEATVLLSCWMTEARIETMQNQKAMFQKVLK